MTIRQSRKPGTGIEIQTTENLVYVCSLCMCACPLPSFGVLEYLGCALAFDWWKALAALVALHELVKQTTVDST